MINDKVFILPLFYWLVPLASCLPIAHPAIAEGSPPMTGHRQHLEPGTLVVQQVDRASSAIERGIELYEQGQLSYAAESFSQAIAEYKASGDRVLQASSLSYLSLVYQDLGEWDAARRTIAESLELLGYDREDASNLRSAEPESAAILAEALNTLGLLMLRSGEGENALETWQQAETAYAIANDEEGILGSQLNQAQALQSLGMYRRAGKILRRAEETIQTGPDSVLKIDHFHALGQVLQSIGSLARSKEILEAGLEIAERLNYPTQVNSILLSLGNTARLQRDTEAAIAYYETAAQNAPGTIVAVEAKLNSLSLQLQSEQWSDAISEIAQIDRQLDNLPISRSLLYARVNLAQSQIELESKASQRSNSLFNSRTSSLNSSAQLLAKTIQQAQQIGDLRAEAFALSQLGRLYEISQQTEEALDITDRALVLAQKIDASDIIAKAFWQEGRLHQQRGDIQKAIVAYQSTVNTLQSLRTDMTAVNADLKFNFRDTVEPVYRQLVSLLLQPLPNEQQVSQKNLKQARQTIEALQLAELDNFFRDACLEVENTSIDEIDPNAAVVYPIILSDRLEVILSMPGQPLRHYTTELPAEEVEDKISRALESINLAFSPKIRMKLSQEIYNWLIRPAEEYLTAGEMETLVFVLDGAFRSLPMSFLHDGEQYLLEKYRLALSPGLELLATQSLKTKRLNLLSAGLTEPRLGFSALPGVEQELQQIVQKVSGAGQILLDPDFTKPQLKQAMQKGDFEVVHIATHGQFSSDFDKTFLLTWDGTLNVTDLEELLVTRTDRTSNPIGLLVLSACETAAGDSRAALGLAGFALRSGASSTLGTLWSVRDESTTLFMNVLYDRLSEPNSSKAEAVRQAQLALLNSPDFNHPFFWSPFILVGNWL